MEMLSPRCTECLSRKREILAVLYDHKVHGWLALVQALGRLVRIDGCACHEAETLRRLMGEIRRRYLAANRALNWAVNER